MIRRGVLALAREATVWAAWRAAGISTTVTAVGVVGAVVVERGLT